MYAASTAALGATTGLGLYLAVSQPSVKMLLPVLNVSVNYSHSAFACAGVSVVIILAVWCYNSACKDHDANKKVDPNTNETAIPSARLIDTNSGNLIEGNQK
jgi:hypothetical protein